MDYVEEMCQMTSKQNSLNLEEMLRQNQTLFAGGGISEEAKDQYFQAVMEDILIVKKLQNKYDETDTFRLAKTVKITVKLRPMGIYEGCCKGFFLISRRMKHITINSDLPELLQKVVLSLTGTLCITCRLCSQCTFS